MSVYLDDSEMEKFLSNAGLAESTDEELLALADRYNDLGCSESSTGALFMRYSIMGFVERRKKNGHLS